MAKPMRAWYKIFVLLLMAMSAACATLLFDIQQPEITVSSFRALPSHGTALNFEIMLHIKNPNPVTLKLNGISYSASIEGHRIISGTADALGSVEANGEGEYPILAQANLVSGAALLVDLVRNPKELVNYEFAATIDIGGLMPDIRIRKKGQLSMSGN
ncbi:MAG: LEA type 2 family protein [Proteobacteria bacterium]|nr:LEA type 2 family protein [Pseudomonadota bacterium]